MKTSHWTTGAMIAAATAHCVGAEAVQDGALSREAYIKPPPQIERLVLAPRHLNVTLGNLSPNGRQFLIARSDGLPKLADLSKPYLNLGGERIDPKANRDRSMTVRGFAGYELFDWSTRSRTTIETPRGSRVSGATWSPDGSRVAFLANFEDATHLYVADAATGAAKRVSKSPLLATLTSSIQWVDGGKRLAAVLVPKTRTPLPPDNGVVEQPLVQVSDPNKSTLRTFPALLKTSRDQALLEHFTTGQLALIDAEGGGEAPIGAPAMIKSFDMSPDGKYARVTMMVKPFSYVVPVSSFGEKEELWDASGKSLAEIASRPIRLTAPEPGVQAGPPTGKRNLTWRPDGKGLSYLEQAPSSAGQRGGESEQGRRGGGAPGEGTQAGAQRPDRVMLWTPPFGKDDAKVVYESDQRIGSVTYSDDASVLFITESRSGNEVLFAVRLAEPSKKLTIYSYRGGEDARSPGSLLTRDNALGLRVARMSPDGSSVYLSGTEMPDDPEKGVPRPFLDQVRLESGEKTRLWESPVDAYETLTTVLDDALTKLVIIRQSPTEVPDSFLLELPEKKLTKLTDNKDRTPDMTSVKRERVQVTRPDGIRFWVEVTLPGWHVAGQKLPAFFWFYPREYADQRAYDRSLRGRNRLLYPTYGPSSKQFLVALGYALVEPDCPIIGPTGRMNDSYVPDLKANLWAVIDALDKRGWIDRDRLAIGGHSYGAFSTANAMIHTPYFKAGIAGDGNYNRLLTPSTFQTERRQLWEARETYLTMSPILFAEQLTGALLMYHGLDDQNVGTDPVNSVRMFHALENLGKHAALYMYPYEDHGQVAQETILDQWARWVAWLDKYVKNAGQPPSPPGPGAPRE